MFVLFSPGTFRVLYAINRTSMVSAVENDTKSREEQLEESSFTFIKTYNVKMVKYDLHLFFSKKDATYFLE